ncbi:MAG: hypothetical protein BWY85_02053 [Firmicutes bacterium ADurb.Bin506]|nr:MAG: hypothetical protein BWY85_02053 [Firmicutes bacterium ADurb.Bin506]
MACPRLSLPPVTDSPWYAGITSTVLRMASFTVGIPGVHPGAPA